MNPNQLLLIDLSAIAHQIWHISGNEPDPSFVSREIVKRVRELSSQHPHTAICCDAGKSFRCDIDPTYKANRDTENRAPLRHQMDVACETLAKDGFPVWRVPGFEADDLIASAVKRALEIDGAEVLIASSDKDLLQLVSDRVTAKSLTNGVVMDADAVAAKFGVRPEQMGDLLALMGDKSDNIRGADGVGQVTAAAMLKAFGTLDAFYAKLTALPLPEDAKRRAVVLRDEFAGISDKQRASLMEFRDRWPTVRRLIMLRTDAPIPFEEIAAERTAPTMEDSSDAGALEYDSAETDRAVNGPSGPLLSAIQAQANPTLGYAGGYDGNGLIAGRPATPIDFSQQLEPRTMPEAIQLAKHVFESRLFGAYGTPQAVLATVLAGRELGIPAMASLRAFHIIEGKPTMSAGTIQSLVLKSRLATYFRCTERTPERATFVTQRGDEPPMSLTYTIEEAKAAWQKTAEAWAKSTWGRSPADMLVARAASKLARLVYPDVVAGLYAPEEME